MAGPTSWETVVHKKKATANDKKAARKNFMQKATIVDDVAPLEDTDTIYSTAFNKNKKEQVNSSKNKEPAKNNQPKKKKDGGKQKQDSCNSLEDALKKLSVEDLQRQWDDVRIRCKTAPSLWLGDIVGVLSRKLDVKESGHQPFTSEPADYPCSILDPKLYNFLSSTLDTYETKMLKEFFDYCLKEMLGDLKKGQPVYAYRIYIQLLVKKHPTFITNSLNHFKELIKKRENERLPCLALFWTCNLAGLKDPVTALQVWGELMLPMMSHKMVAPFAVQTLERILSEKLDKQKANSVFGPTEFVPLLDVIFTSNVALPPNLQKTLLKLYPKLKVIAYGPDPSTSLHKFFPSYLTRLTKDCPQNYKNELLKGLVYCLGTGSLCLSGWRQMYVSHMAQSSILLKHLVETWPQTRLSLPEIPFHETIRAFSLTNEELAQKNGGKKSFEDCRKSCKFLMEQMETKSFPWRPVALAVLALLIAAFIVDLILHRGFTYSLTHQFMQKTGISHALMQAWSKITLYSGIAFSWLATNVPHYYVKVCELCGPYLRLLVQKLEWLGLKILELMDPAIVWLNEQVPLLLQWIQTKAPIVLAAVQENLTLAWSYVSSATNSMMVVAMPYLLEAWEAISFYGLIFWESVEPAISSAWLWIKTSVGAT